MTGSTRSPRQQEFDNLYRREADPWGFETSAYERDKYAATLAALPRLRFSHGLEVGCSIGVFSAQLAQKCDRLTALDVSTVALDKARARSGTENATFLQAEVPRDWPRASYDLVVLSEVLYFLNQTEIEAVADLVARDLVAGGVCLLVNWTGENERPLDGAQAAGYFVDRARKAGLQIASTKQAETYRLDLLETP